MRPFDTGPAPLDQRWRKSSRSFLTSNCVEVRRHTGLVQVRDSKSDGTHVLSFTPADWRRFVRALRVGDA